MSSSSSFSNSNKVEIVKIPFKENIKEFSIDTRNSSLQF